MELFAWMLQEALDVAKTENVSKREAGRPKSYRPILTVLDEGSALKGRGIKRLVGMRQIAVVFHRAALERIPRIRSGMPWRNGELC